MLAMRVTQLQQQLKQLTSLRNFRPAQLRQASGMPVDRDPCYARIEEGDISVFRGILGDAGVLTDSGALESMNEYGPEPPSHAEQSGHVH